MLVICQVMMSTIPIKNKGGNSEWRQMGAMVFKVASEGLSDMVI